VRRRVETEAAMVMAVLSSRADLFLPAEDRYELSRRILRFVASESR